MKLCLLILVCCLLVGLLLSLTQAVGLNYRWPVVGLGRGFDRGTGPASDASTESFITSMEFHPARAGPLESLVFDCVLTADNIGPPGQETLWAAATDEAFGELPVKPATQINAIEPFLRKITGSTDRI